MCIETRFKMATAGTVDNGESYNVEKVLRSNIVYSDYYRQLCGLDDFYVLVDEMYNEVTHVEPWMRGGARNGPSTAFCILYRLFTLTGDGGLLDESQINHLLRHGDSPYIRAIGFLYLRYVCPHKELQKYFATYFADDEIFAPTRDETKTVSMGAFVRDLICDQSYFGTIFPRIPEVTRRELVKTVEQQGFGSIPVGCGGTGGHSRRGEKRQAPQSVNAALSANLNRRAPNAVSGTDQSGRERNYRDTHDTHRGFKGGNGQPGRDGNLDRGYGGRDDRGHGGRDGDRNRGGYDRDDRDRGRYHPYQAGRDDRRRSRSRSRDRGRDAYDDRRDGNTNKQDASKPRYR